MQQQMQQQDDALDHISIHVDRIKHTGQLMHEELEEQVCVKCMPVLILFCWHVRPTAAAPEREQKQLLHVPNDDFELAFRQGRPRLQFA
jgi:hypothetical protein